MLSPRLHCFVKPIPAPIDTGPADPVISSFPPTLQFQSLFSPKYTPFNALVSKKPAFSYPAFPVLSSLPSYTTIPPGLHSTTSAIPSPVTSTKLRLLCPFPLPADAVIPVDIETLFAKLTPDPPLPLPPPLMCTLSAILPLLFHLSVSPNTQRLPLSSFSACSYSKPYPYPSSSPSPFTESFTRRLSPISFSLYSKPYFLTTRPPTLISMLAIRLPSLLTYFPRPSSRSSVLPSYSTRTFRSPSFPYTISSRTTSSPSPSFSFL